MSVRISWSRRRLIGALIAATLTLSGTIAGSTAAFADDGDTTYFDDGAGNAVTSEPGLAGQDLDGAIDVPASSQLDGDWYSNAGQVVHFDGTTGRVTSGQLGRCTWPNQNLAFANVKLLSGVNVFSASTISSWVSHNGGGTDLCAGPSNIEFKAGVVITLGGTNYSTLKITGANYGVSDWTRVDRAPRGYLDNCGGGWAVDDDYSGAIQVDVYSDGQFYGSIQANQSTGDSVGAHRFALTPPSGTHRLNISAIGVDAGGNRNNVNVELQNSPQTCTA